MARSYKLNHHLSWKICPNTDSHQIYHQFVSIQFLRSISMISESQQWLHFTQPYLNVPWYAGAVLILNLSFIQNMCLMCTISGEECTRLLAEMFDLIQTTPGSHSKKSSCILRIISSPKDLGIYWLGYVRMLGHLQMSAHLVKFERLLNLLCKSKVLC